MNELIKSVNRKLAIEHRIQEEVTRKGCRTKLTSTLMNDNGEKLYSEYIYFAGRAIDKKKMQKAKDIAYDRIVAKVSKVSHQANA